MRKAGPRGTSCRRSATRYPTTLCLPAPIASCIPNRVFLTRTWTCCANGQTSQVWQNVRRRKILKNACEPLLRRFLTIESAFIRERPCCRPFAVSLSLLVSSAAQTNANTHCTAHSIPPFAVLSKRKKGAANCRPVRPLREIEVRLRVRPAGRSEATRPCMWLPEVEENDPRS